ncbi:unnamed protein product [Staurois parvus]|uniref:Uncharacterized protein n=1 Tax=Staurois parvus TaxID=386267 RepID=A0ABN9DHK4_9NEOB|nr:unnamed protein product [Staurois parvus]
MTSSHSQCAALQSAGTDDQCALMISVAPAVPPVSVHQCHINAYQCTSMPHISAHLSCLSV